MKARPMHRLPRWSAIPIPLGGGTMHNKVVYHAMKVLNDAGMGSRLAGAALQLSRHRPERGHARRPGRVGDVLAALDWLGANTTCRSSSPDSALAQPWRSPPACASSAPAASPTLRALVALGLPTHGFKRSLRIPSSLAPARSPSSFSAATATSLRLPKRSWSTRCRFRRRTQDPGAQSRRRSLLHRHLEPMQTALAGWLKEQLT